MPRVSVIVATFNARATLQACLDSVLAQTEPCELIVVDGGSSDGTRALLESYRARLDALLCEPDRGVYDALNKGVRLATGDYIYILGSDDRLAHPDALRDLLAGGDADVLYGHVQVQDVAGRMHDAAPHPLARFKYHMPLSHQAVLVRRSLMLRSPFGLSLASDYRALFRLYLQGARFEKVETCVAVYALGGMSDRQAVRSTWDRWRINRELRGWRSIDVLPWYAAQVAVCWLKPKLLRALGRGPAAPR